MKNEKRRFPLFRFSAFPLFRFSASLLVLTLVISLFTLFVTGCEDDSPNQDYAQLDQEINDLMDKYVADGLAVLIEKAPVTRSTNAAEDTEEEEDDDGALYHDFVSQEAVDAFMNDIDNIRDELGFSDEFDEDDEACIVDQTVEEPQEQPFARRYKGVQEFTYSQIDKVYKRGGERNCKHVGWTGPAWNLKRKYFCSYGAEAYLKSPIPIVGSTHEIIITINGQKAYSKLRAESRSLTHIRTRNGKGIKGGTVNFWLRWYDQNKKLIRSFNRNMYW